MSHRAYLPAAIMFAAITAATAHAGSENAILLNPGLSSDGSAGWPDTPDDKSVVIGTGDFNRDGIADVVEARLRDPKNPGHYVLTVLLGQTDGRFRTVPSHNLIGAKPRALVVGDFNGDGDPDVIVGDADGTLLEFFGDGKGNLVAAKNIAAVGSVASIATGHFTHGGNLDLVVSDVRSNSAVILLGGGDGSFRFTWSFELPRKGTEFHIATADFNKDGITDLAITSEDSNNYEVLLGNGNGTFTYAPELSHLRDPYSYCPS